jgi:hypothetical protein
MTANAHDPGGKVRPAGCPASGDATPAPMAPIASRGAGSKTFGHYIMFIGMNRRRRTPQSTTRPCAREWTFAQREGFDAMVSQCRRLPPPTLKCPGAGVAAVSPENLPAIRKAAARQESRAVPREANKALAPAERNLSRL